MEFVLKRRPRDLMDPACTNPEKVTSTSTTQDLLNEEIHKLAMQTHLEVQQREDIRRDLAERVKFVFPDLRLVETVFYWQEDLSKIQQGRKSGKIFEGGNYSCERLHGGYQYRCDHFSCKCKQTEKTCGHWIWNNLQIRVSGQAHLCCG